MVRALGTSGLTRSPILPDVPTIAEAGVAGFQFSQWTGFMAPKDTPAQVVNLLNKTITGILSRPDVKDAWEKQGATPMVMTQREFAAFMTAQVAKWAKVISDNHIKPID